MLLILYAVLQKPHFVPFEQSSIGDIQLLLLCSLQSYEVGLATSLTHNISVVSVDLFCNWFDCRNTVSDLEILMPPKFIGASSNDQTKSDHACM